MTFRAVLAGLLLAIVLIVAAIAGLVYWGVYNVAADAPDSGVVAKLIAATRERSIDVRVANVKVPPLDKKAMIREGAAHYADMCVGCHLAPGMAENEMRPGMNPEPPALASRPPGNPAEQFWIIKHGIRMTAMPAWGKTHTNAEIWDIVAFLQNLPSLSQERYRTLTRGAHGEHMHMGE